MKWDDFKTFIRDIEPLLTFASTILWGVYVYYTMKTFLQIKRQTELQSEAFLMTRPTVELLTSSASPDERLVALFGGVHRPSAIARVDKRTEYLRKKWSDILTKNIPAAFGQSQMFTLSIKNHGKSDVIAWSLSLKLVVKPSQFLREKANTAGETLDWIVEGNDVIGAGESIKVNLLQIEPYPQAEISWDLTYSDVRGVKYARFGGDKTYLVTNPLASPALS